MNIYYKEPQIPYFFRILTANNQSHEQTLFPLRDREYDILFSEMTRQGELAFRSVHDVFEQKLPVGREYPHVFQTLHWRKHVNHPIVHCDLNAVRRSNWSSKCRSFRGAQQNFFR